MLKYAHYSDSLTGKYAAEKLYMQLDKQDYAVGDTIWLKAYLFNAASHTLSSHSGLLHIALVNDSNKITKQALLQLKDGVGWGNIGLSVKEFDSGDYTLIAYTSWMMNFSQDIFFRKRIRIAVINENAWLINSKIDQGKGTINAKLQLTGVDKVPYADSVLRLEITEGRKRLYYQLIRTDRNGLLDFRFFPPARSDNLKIKLINKSNTKSAVVPISINRGENTDVQFMAEGGDLTAGLKGHIGFKAVGEDGRGVDIKGTIVDGTGKQVGVLSSSYKGMGSFDLTPYDNKAYIAKVELPGGMVKDYPLPAVKRSGITLHVKNSFKSDSVELSISATPDIIQLRKSYFLTGKARGVICYAAALIFTKGVIHRFVSKRLFPSGITHFILSTTDGKPLNERLVFINRDDDLNIKINPGELAYSTRDSVDLNLSVTKQNGDPIEGSFSLAVTDDAQINPDSVNTDNILTRMLLTSDLKGYIESPGDYFQDNESSFNALDDLLLTQGWVSYEPVEGKTLYPAEKEYTVNGSVKNVLGKPVKGTHVLLFSKSPTILMDTVTNSIGKFTFDRFPRVDMPIFILKALNKSGKSFNVAIEPVEIPTPVFKLPSAPLSSPWYVNSDSTLKLFINSNVAYQNLQGYVPGGKHQLKEVVIRSKKIVKDSRNENGPGNADIVLDERDLEAAGKKTWLQLLKENIKGFREGVLLVDMNYERSRTDIPLFAFVTDGHWDDVPQQTIKSWYYIKDKPVKFIIDGTPVYKLHKPNGVAFNDITDYLTSHSAEDIKGIEVNLSTKYAMKYVPSEWIPWVHPSDCAFVEITTRAGRGPMIDNTPGMYLYKPLAITWPAQFYKPKYSMKDTLQLPDYRSTIDWEPNIVTDKNGKATVSFYAADKPSTYTVIVEGADANGNIGYKRQKIVVSQKKIETKSK